MLPHHPEVQEKYILNFESSLQVASLRRGIGVCAMLGEPQLRVRVPRMCQPWWCPAASEMLVTSLLKGDGKVAECIFLISCTYYDI